jgi:hypothetical protein
MEAIIFSETSDHTTSTRRHIPEGDILQNVSLLYRIQNTFAVHLISHLVGIGGYFI